jgi:hypothetical protein
MTVTSDGVLSGQAARDVRREQRMAALLRECEGVRVRDWQDKAKCRGADLELFCLADADSGVPTSRVNAVNLVRHAAAARYCRECPVRLACLADALERGSTGTWGAELLTEEDHLAARRVRRQMWKETQ